MFESSVYLNAMEFKIPNTEKAICPKTHFLNLTKLVMVFMLWRLIRFFVEKKLNSFLVKFVLVR